MSDKPDFRDQDAARDARELQTFAKHLDFASNDFMLPYAAETERAALGTIILSDRARLASLSLLSHEDFHVAAYKHVFQCIETLAHEGTTCDPITIGSLMKKRGFLQEIGGVHGITDLTYGVSAGSEALKEYSKELRQLSIKRRLFEQIKNVAIDVFNQKLSADDLLDRTETTLSQLRAKTSLTSTLKTYKQLAVETRHELDKWRRGESGGISTGIPEFDKKLHARGFARKELYYFAALSSMGKTALVLQMLDNLKMRGMRGMIFSLEMASIRLMLRTIQRMSSGLEISPYTIREITEPKDEKTERRKRYSDYAYRRACELLQQMENWQGVIDDETTDWSQIKAKARQYHAEGQLDFIAGDYIQICNITMPRQNARRDQEIGRISTESKNLAKELDVPFIWISQLSRDAKPGVRPEMGNLKESSQLEQDADFVGFLYGKGASKEKKKETFLYGAKQRNGIAGWELPMDFAANEQLFITAEIQRLRDMSPPSEDEMFLMEFAQQVAPQPALTVQAPSQIEAKDKEIKF